MRVPDLGEAVFIRPAARFIKEGEALSAVMRAPGLRLPAEGVEVQWSSFLIERYRSGEIEIGQLPAPPTPAAPASEEPPAPAAPVAAPTHSPTEVTP